MRRLKVADMVRLGLCMNLIGIVTILVFLYMSGTVLFGLAASPVPAVWRIANTSSAPGESE